MAAVSWRAPFLLLAAMGFALGYFVARKLPERRLWGRAEGARSTIVYIATPVFGWLAAMLGGGAGGASLAPAAARGGQGINMKSSYQLKEVA